MEVNNILMNGRTADIQACLSNANAKQHAKHADISFMLLCTLQMQNGMQKDISCTPVCTQPLHNTMQAIHALQSGCCTHSHCKAACNAMHAGLSVNITRQHARQHHKIACEATQQCVQLCMYRHQQHCMDMMKAIALHQREN